VQTDKERAKLSLLGGVAAIILGNFINSEPVKNNMIGSVQDVAQTAIPAAIRGSFNVALRAKTIQDANKKTQAVNELCCYAALFVAGKIVYELISPENDN